MGSFANSLHVQCADAEQVAGAIRDVLALQQWQPTTRVPDKEQLVADGARARELHVSAPAGGWVSVLDSDLSSLERLTRDLAVRLKTRALLCFVDDSDSWSYQLADPSGELSVFDSAQWEGEDDDDRGGETVGFAQAGEAIQRIQAMMKDGAVQQRMQQIQTQMTAAAPPEVRAAEERIRNRQGTTADIQTYQSWAVREMPKYMADMRAMLASVLPQTDASPNPGPQPAATQREVPPELLANLRPILAAGVKDEQVQVVLSKQAVFAEETLAEFLPLVGVARFFAYLSYDYLDDARPAELAEHSIRFAHRLRFEKQAKKRKR